MGNRANVIFASEQGEISPAVYLHWNGGAESIYAFLDELERRGANCHSPSYSAARFVEVVGDFFDSEHFDGYSLGIVNGPDAITPEAIMDVCTDHTDNGVYVVYGGGKTRKVRRFILVYPSAHSNAQEYLREWTEIEVDREREEAYKDAYMQPDGIPAAFLKIGNGRMTTEEHYKAKRAEEAVTA